MQIWSARAAAYGGSQKSEVLPDRIPRAGSDSQVDSV